MVVALIAMRGGADVDNDFAAQIVSACNNFDALVAALEGMIDMATDSRCHGGEIDAACAALAKARGE